MGFASSRFVILAKFFRFIIIVSHVNCFIGNAWKLQSDLKQGVHTCMYASGCGWLAIGTSSGRICAWDLRFSLPITTLMYPKGDFWMIFVQFCLFYSFI